MADLREQLNAIADRLDHLDGHDVDESEELEWAVKQLRALAAQPAPDTVPLNAVRAALEAVDTGRTQIARDNLRILEIHLRAQVAQPAPAGEVALPEPDLSFNVRHGHCVQAYSRRAVIAYGDARAAAAASRPATAVPEGWRDVLDKIRDSLDSGTPSPFDNGEYRRHASVLIDRVSDELDALSAAPQPEAINSHPEIPDNSVDTPQPAAVKQDLTTAQGESTDLTSAAKRLYGSYTDNHPTMHCNRFATWDELGAEQQNEWLHRARMRGLAAIEQASYVGAGGHGIPDEPQPEAKAGAEVTDAMIDAGYAAMLRISFAASPRERLSAMWAAMHAAQPKPADVDAEAGADDEPADVACWQHRPGALCPWPESCKSNGCSAVERELFQDEHPKPAEGGAEYVIQLRLTGGYVDEGNLAQARAIAAQFFKPAAATRAEEVEENRLISLPNNDAVPAATRIEPGNLFLWNWTAMQDYGRACVEADRIARRLAGKEE